MIRQDLEDISKLKQSTLKETIKYSFLYPQTESVFNSIKDLQLTPPSHAPVTPPERHTSVAEFSVRDRLQQFQAGKESFIERQN